MDLVFVGKAIGALSLLGLISSAVLSTAARRFHVEVDARVERIAGILPGSNCGACGRPSCFATAEAIVDGSVPVSACIAGGQDVADAVAEALGVEACEVTAVVVARHCGGGRHAARAYSYDGIASCATAAKLAGGPLVCAWGCLGFGDCVRACPFDALALDERGLPVVVLDRCTGCGVCVSVCPRTPVGLLELVPERARVVVRCSARSRPKDRKAACGACCIACKRCEKACPADAIHVIDGIAVVDHQRCTGCGACVEVCPQQCIDVYGRGHAADPRDFDGKGKAAPGFSVERTATAVEE